jgi:hypothetical protein
MPSVSFPLPRADPLKRDHPFLYAWPGYGTVLAGDPFFTSAFWWSLIETYFPVPLGYRHPNCQNCNSVWLWLTGEGAKEVGQRLGRVETLVRTNPNQALL